MRNEHHFQKRYEQARETNLALQLISVETLTITKMTQLSQIKQNHNMGTDDLNTNQITQTELTG